jgi:hypothetical protein
MTTNLLNHFVELQQKTMETVFKNAENMPLFLKDIFGSPENLYKTPWMTPTSGKLMYENNRKFNEAYIKYHQSIVDMMTALSNNADLINNETIKSN